MNRGGGYRIASISPYLQDITRKTSTALGVKVLLVFSILIFMYYASVFRVSNCFQHDVMSSCADEHKTVENRQKNPRGAGFEIDVSVNSFGRMVASQRQYCSDLSRIIDMPPPLVTVSIADIHKHPAKVNQSVHNSSQISDAGHMNVNYEDKYNYLSNASNTMTLQRLDNIGSSRDNTYTLYALKSTGHSNDIVSGSLESSRQWERNEIDKIISSMNNFASSHNLSRSDVYFVDIGANVGTFSFAAAAAGFMVISFEAMRINQRALQLSLCSNPKLLETIAVYNIALGKEEANCSIYSTPGNVLDGTIGCGTSPPLPEMIFRQSLNVVPLDMALKDLIPSITGKVAAVKMDTEGFEPWVIKGGQEFFSKVRPPFFTTELNSIALRTGSGYSPMDFVRQILSLGYDLRRPNFDGPFVTERQIEEDLGKGDSLMNLYFTSKNSKST